MDCVRLPIAAHTLAVMPVTSRMPRIKGVLGSVLTLLMKSMAATVMIMPEKTVQSPQKKLKTSIECGFELDSLVGSIHFIFGFSVRRLIQRIRIRLSSR